MANRVTGPAYWWGEDLYLLCLRIELNQLISETIAEVHLAIVAVANRAGQKDCLGL